MRRKKKKIKIKKSNKEFLVIMYLFLAVFLSMMIYFVYFRYVRVNRLSTVRIIPCRICFRIM